MNSFVMDRSPVLCRALTRLLGDESTLNPENIDVFEKLVDAFHNLGARTCDASSAGRTVDVIEAAGRRLAMTLSVEDVDVVGALLGRIGQIRKRHRASLKDEL